MTDTPTATARLTVADLKAALAGRPDDELVTVYVNGWYYHTFVQTADDYMGEELLTVVMEPDMDAPFDTRFDI